MRKLKKIDYVIVGFVVLLIGVFVYKQTSGIYNRFEDNGNIPEMETMTYTYQVDEVRILSYEAVEIGDTFFDYDSKSVLGTVVDKKLEPFMKGILKDNGDYVLAEVPERYMMYITIEGPVLETDNKYLANGAFELKMNSYIKLANQKAVFQARIAWFNE